jgi:hypothetical protein
VDNEADFEISGACSTCIKINQIGLYCMLYGQDEEQLLNRVMHGIHAERKLRCSTGTIGHTHTSTHAHIHIHTELQSENVTFHI